MIKLAVIALSLLGGGALVVGAARTYYSGVSIAIPVGGAIKMTPDPASVWSWHEEITGQPGQTVTVPVLVDFDGNGNMDTEYPDLRVCITDVQAVSSGTIDAANGQRGATVVLRNGGGTRWDITPLPHGGADNQATTGQLVSTHHFATPLVLPIASSLNVAVTLASNEPPRTISVNLIGRIVNL
ncbi:MAG: hypothetical protein IPN34_14605 [Planctomycetes bacterium]|nr:hypothetical protein [Planctomycetota bacterium]